LLAGVYSIDCSLVAGDNGMMHIDELFEAASFTVKDIKRADGGIYASQKDALYAVDHEWLD
jgi:hypothetical protein